MSKGSPVLRARVPLQLVIEIQAQIRLTQVRGGRPDLTVSAWLTQAAREKLRHMVRSRRRRRSRLPTECATPPPPALDGAATGR
jgi:DNA-directed RNA polymerase specialized sigma24 family protein